MSDLNSPINSFINLVRSIYKCDTPVSLHEPSFTGNEKQYLLEVLASTYVSSVGEYVDRFETACAEYTGTKFAIATVNGTAALHIALLLAGVRPGEEVITQALTFVATCNAIHYCGAEPVFVDVDKENLGLSSQALNNFLQEFAEIRGHLVWNKHTGRRIAACVPMHTFGHPVNITDISTLCKQYAIPIVEDAAEALGSRWSDQHCGTFGSLGILSFNGNKIITSGGGGMILTDDPALAKQAKYLTTTAKQPHPWLFFHDQVGFNYRMPNLNAALGLAQLESLHSKLIAKRKLAAQYQEWSKPHPWQFLSESPHTQANYWLNALILNDRTERDLFLLQTNAQGIMTRPIWEPMHHLPMYQHCYHDGLINTDWLADRVVNIPSSVKD